MYEPAVQRDAAEKAIARYQVLLTNEPLQALTLAECYQQLSRAQVSLGDYASAYDALEQARQQLQTLTPQQLEETTILELLTLNDLDRAHVLLLLGRLDEATQSARRGREAITQWFRHTPRPQWQIDMLVARLRASQLLAQALRYQKQTDEGLKECREALGRCSINRMDYVDHRGLAQCEADLTRELAELELAAGKPADAAEQFRAGAATETADLPLTDEADSVRHSLLLRKQVS